MKSKSHFACMGLVVAMILSGITAVQAEGLDEITVTATKRDSTLTEVPMSIVAVNPAMLVENGWNQTTDILDYVPNVTFYQNGTESIKLNIRGVHSDGPNNTLEASVAVFTDGIYGPSPLFLRAPLLDLQGVEIQRGPQATYFGHNATAGSLSFTSKRQPLDSSDGFLLVEGSGEGHNKVDFAYGAPLSDSFGLRLSGAYRSEDGHIRNVTKDLDVPEFEDSIVRLSAVWQVSDATDVFAKIEDYSSEAKGSNREPLTCGNAGAPWGAFPCAALFGLGASEGLDDQINGGATVLPNYNVQILNFGPPLFLPVTSGIANVADAEFMGRTGTGTDATRFALEINHDFGAFTLTSLTGYESGEYFTHRDADLSPAAALALDSDSEYDFWSEEIRLVSNGESFDWMVGVMMQNNEIDGINRVIHNQNIPNYCNPLPFGPPGCFTPGDLLGGSDVGLPFPIPGVLGGTDARWERKIHNQEDDTFAVFFDLGFDLSDNLALKLGARYTDVEKTGVTVVESAPMASDGSPGAYSVIVDTSTGFYDGITDSTAADGDYSETSTDPYVTLQYAVGDNANIYASWSSAFKAGGFTVAPGVSIPLGILGYPDTYEYDGEESESVEVGYKGLLMDGRLELNAAIFKTEFDNQHTVLFNTGTPGVSTLGPNFSTAGIDSEQTGFELDGRFAASDNLTLNFSLGLLDATMDEASILTVYGDSICQDGEPCPDNLIHAPEWSAALWAPCTASQWGTTS